MIIQTSKVAVIGAGSVGTSLAYAMLIRESARTVALYDLNQEKVDAEVLDLAHGTPFTGASQVMGGADISVIADSDVVVITAGAKQSPGQTRLELAGTNIRILESLMPQLLEYAPHAIYVLVTNPCDVLTVAAQEISGLPAQRVLSSGTVLDTGRLRWLLGKRFNIATRNVHAHIVGEHGDTEFPLWSSATVGIVPLLDWVVGEQIAPAELEEIATQVRNAAYRVIQGKGATNYAIGLSGAMIVEAILQDQRGIMPVSTLLTGQFAGVQNVALSVPSIVGRHGALPVKETPFSASELRQLQDSADALLAVQKSLGIRT